ncbi:MAG: hypothetical protein IKU62_08530 [Ruminiclostridium sp.]|nr:hypothetical protein [Ruminiclostridium sp.]
MGENLLIALVSGGVTLAVCLINNFLQQGRTRALLEYKLSELTQRVNKHNDLVERTYRLEEQVSLSDERLKELTRRLDKLEGKEDCGC